MQNVCKVFFEVSSLYSLLKKDKAITSLLDDKSGESEIPLILKQRFWIFWSLKVSREEMSTNAGQAYLIKERIKPQ